MTDRLPPTPDTQKAIGHPYSRLSPDLVLEALDSVGLRGDGRLLQLNSYENRVFQVHLESGEVVVAKFYRPDRWTDAQILEEHDFSRALADAEVPVVAPMTLDAADHGVLGAAQIRITGSHGSLAHWQSGESVWRFAVTPRKAGRSPELDDPDAVQWLGRFMARVHQVGERQPFLHRRRLTPAVWGWEPRRWLLEQGAVTPSERDGWAAASAEAIHAVERQFEAVADVPILRLHGDAHPGNILWRPEGPHVVDLDDACMGPAMQDLWMLLPGDTEGARRQMDWLLRGYETIRPFDDRELGLVEALRTLRMLHHMGWLAQRWSDPAFPHAFPFFGSAAYWSEQTTHLREQLLRMEGTA